MANTELVSLFSSFTLFLFFNFVFYLLILEREGQRKRNISLLFHLFMHSLIVSYMCLGWGLNLQPWHIRTNGAGRPGPHWHYSWSVMSRGRFPTSKCHCSYSAKQRLPFGNLATRGRPWLTFALKAFFFFFFFLLNGEYIPNKHFQKKNHTFVCPAQSRGKEMESQLTVRYIGRPFVCQCLGSPQWS